MGCWALCIGVNEYQHTSTLRPLRGCANDARDIGELLSAHGFNVTLLIDATCEEMHDAVVTLIENCGEKDKVVVSLSGHGAQFENDNFLFPADFGMPKWGNGVLRNTARDALAIHADIVVPLQKKNKRGLNVVITDMCRSTTRFRGQEEIRGRVEPGLKKREDIPTGTLVAFACEQGHTSLDTGRNGVYTEVLLKHLARPIDISKLFRIVTTEVQKKQVGEVNPMQPWYNANLLGGEEDIVLVEVTSAGGASSLPLFSALRLGVGASQQRKSGGAASKFVNPYDEE